MEKIVLVVHVLTALAIIGLILLQQGKGAAAGASFGAGASQTVFGSQGGGSFFTRATAIFATLFFCTSFGLAVIAKNRTEVAVSDIPTIVESKKVQQSDVPEVEAAKPAANEVPGVPATDVPAVEASSEAQDVPATE